MEINIFDADLNRLGVVDEIASLIWTRRYWSCGDFSLLLPMTDKHIGLLQMGRLVIPHGYKEAGEIQYIHISTDQQGQEEIEIQGKFIPCWLGKRIMVRQMVQTDAPETIMHQIVAENVTDAKEAARTIPQLSSVVPAETGSTIEYASEEHANVLDEIEMIAGASEVGFRVLSDPKEKTHTFDIYTGRDLTAGNVAGNEPCIFSRDFDNVLSQDYIRSRENVRNMAYVFGEEREDDTHMLVKIGDNLSGLDRYEVYISASDISQTYKDENEIEITRTDAEYEALIRQRGEAELAQYTEADEFESQINPHTSLVYRKDYDVGDMVTCVDKRWGITQNTRITEAREIYQKGEEEIELTFGKALPTLSQRIKQIQKGG